MSPRSHRSRPPQDYHHGALREALIAAALAQIEAGKVARISLRQVARAAGVSHMAPYNHFRDKAALVAAAAAEGFRMLHEEIVAGMAGFSPGDPQRLQAAGIAYAAFAVAHPELFRLMFGPELADKRNHPELAAAVTAVEEALFQGMREAGMAPTAGWSQVTALAPWAMVHGVAMLAVARLLPKGSERQIKDLTRDLTYLLFVGLANWPKVASGKGGPHAG